MQVVIAFYRIRAADGAHAIVGRESADCSNLGEAIALGRRLALTLAMPQRPDAMSLSDPEGVTLYSCELELEEIREEKPAP
jgi:hypothetical protein